MRRLRPLRFIISALFLFICSLSLVHAATVTYMGNYTYQGKPSIIIQFDGEISSNNVAELYKVKGSGRKKDRAKNETLIPNAKWTFNPAHTALIYTDVTMNQKYRVKLLDGINAKNHKSKLVTIYEIIPQVKLMGRGPIVPSDGSRTIPISVVNAKQLTVEVLQMDKPKSLIDRNYYNKNIRLWSLQNLRKDFHSVTTLSFDMPKAPVNQDLTTAIQLPKELKNGWYVLNIKVAGDFDSSHFVLAQVLLTDLGLQAKIFPKRLALSMESFSGKALPAKAEVYIYGEKNKQTKLGEMTSGQQSFDYKVNKGDLLVVKAGEQMTALPLKEVPLDLSDFHVTGRDYQQTEAFIYSNRDLFKPGETLPLNIILRDDDGSPLPKQRLYVEYRKPDSTIVSGRWLDPSESAQGFYQDEFVVPASAPLGQWTVDVLANKDAQRPLSQFSFNVSEFVPERMDMTIKIAKGLQNNVTSLPVAVTGRYLFGAPADGNKLAITPYYQVLRHFDGEFKDYFVGKKFSIRRWDDVPSIDPITLDKQGKTQFDLPLLNPNLMQSPVLARFNFALYETGGASIQRSRSMLLWNGKSVPGIRPAKADFDSYSNAHFDLALLSKEGDKRIAGKLQYRLERNRGDYYWTYSEDEGWTLHHDSGWQPVVSDFVNVKAGESAPLDAKVEWGQYRLIVTNEQQVATVYNFWAGWWWYGDNEDAIGQRPVKPDELNMTLDQKSYASNGKVVATINSDVAGSLHLSLESDKVEWHSEQTIGKGKHQFTIPLNGLKRHDLYLSATLIANHGAMPRRLFTIKPVALQRDDRKLHISIQHAAQLLPLKGADIKVKLANAPKEPTWVTVSLVDRGIINLARYKVPKMYPWFFGQRRYRGDIIDLYSRIYEQRPDSFVTHRYGGDTDTGANAKLGQTVESKTVTIMSKPVAFNAQGEAVIHVDLPDYNGEAQIVAMAFNQHQYGQAQSDVKIAAPIVAELAVPRFLTPGDTSQTLLEVFNSTDTEQTVAASLNSNDALQFQGQTDFHFILAPGERTHVAVAFNVLPIKQVVTTAKLGIDIHATGEGTPAFNQQRSWHIPVRLTQPVVSKKTRLTLSANSGAANSVVVEQRFWDGLQRSNLTGMKVSYATSPQISYLTYADNLFHYPYGCAEQTTSKAMPWLLDDPELQPLKQKTLYDDEGERDVLKTAILRLATMQKANGSFSLWNKYGREYPWISVYVTDFLQSAAGKYPDLVPENMLEEAQENIRRYSLRRNLWDSRFYSVWVRAKAKNIDYTELWNVTQDVSGKTLTPVSAAYLGGALLLAGQQQEGERFMNMVDQAPYHRYYWDNYNIYYHDYGYGSYVRDYARAVVVLSKVGKVIKLSNEMIALRNRLVERVNNHADNRWYLSTQEQTALIEAGIALKANMHDPVSVALKHNGEQQAYHATGIGYIDIQPGDTVINKLDKPIYLQVTTTGLADNSRMRSTVEFEKAARTYLRADGKPYNGEPLNMGDKLIVSVTYELKKDMRSAMVVEYIPTGFVLENPQTTNSDDLIRQAQVKATSSANMIEYRNDRYVASLHIKGYTTYHFNYVIRAETPGQSVAPPLYLEDMYQPEDFVYEDPAAVQSFTINKLK